MYSPASKRPEQHPQGTDIRFRTVLITGNLIANELFSDVAVVASSLHSFTPGLETRTAETTAYSATFSAHANTVNLRNWLILRGV